MDKLSILHALDRNTTTTKTWLKDGSLSNYNAGKYFKHEYAEIGCVADMYALLLKLEDNPKALAIRGALITGTSPVRVRRTYLSDENYFEDQPLHLFCIDIDGFVPLVSDPVQEPWLAINEYLDRMFADGSFNGVSYAWQLSSSAGHTKNEGVLKAHVWFWSSAAYTSEQMKAWSSAHKEYVDIALYNPVQVHYVALPRFEAGVVDPVPQRCGLVEGMASVALAFDSPCAATAAAPRKSKAFKLTHAMENDPTAQFMVVNKLVLATDKSGKMHIVCPFEEEHTGESGVSSTSYFPAHTGGFQRGHFECLHAHCAERSDDAFRFKMGMADVVIDDFDVVEDEAVERKATWAERVESATSEKALQLIITGGIAADKSLDAVDLSKLEILAKAKFAELGAPLRADPLRKLFKPKQHRALPDVTGEDRPQETIANVEAVCANNDVHVRYNVVKKDDEILIRGASWSVDNAKSASLTWVRSACHKADVPTKHLKNIITLIADKNQFNPVVEWITSREWDGESRVQAFYDTVVENKDECPRHLKELIMKRWAMSAVAAAFSPTGVTARGVLVFQGVQYVGKTRWIDALAPKDLDLIKTGRALNVHDKDSVKQIISCWISELGELDATFKKSDIAALKAFITNDSDELRRPYAEGESRYARRTVFAASVNEKTFLQDDTGNTRFWVVSITAIDHAHKLDMQQVWAEFYAMWCGGELHYMSGDEMRELNHNNEVFTSPEPISEMVASHLDWEKFSLDNCVWMQPSDVLRWIGHKNPTKWDCTVAGKTIAKLNGGHRRKSNGQRLTAVPLELKGIGGGDFV